MYMRGMLAFAIIVTAWAACADSIRVGDTTYDDVYVVKGSTMYYISIPEDGTVLNVDIAEVDPSSVKITENKALRRELFERWSAKNRERLNLSPPVVAEATEPEPEPETNPNEPKKIKVTASAQTNAVYDPQRELMMQQIRNRNAAANALRRQREADKYRTLNSVRLYTSAEVGGAGGGYGVSTGGYVGTGGYSGGGSLGMTGAGGTGGRRR